MDKYIKVDDLIKMIKSMEEEIENSNKSFEDQIHEIGILEILEKKVIELN